MATAILKIQADTSSALQSINQIDRALGTLNSSASSVTRTMNGLTSAFQTAAAAVIGASLFNFVDQLQNMENKLRIASKSQEEFNMSLAYVKAIADKTGQSLSATGDLYAAVARNAEKLGYDQAQIVTVTNAMATALKASGASAQGSASVMYQFSQILAKGKVNGDEFTTIMENLGGPVMDLVAAKMGVTTAELVKLKEKGLIGAKDFTDALIKSMGELDSMSGKAIPTLSQNLQRVQNSFGDFIMKLDKATGFTAMLAKAMDWLAKNVDTVVPILAAFVGYFVAGRILSFVAAMWEVVKVIRAVGIAAAVTEALATGGIAAIAGLAGATAAYLGAQAIFDKVDGSIQQMNVDLKATGETAASSLGTTNTQLSGISDKYKEILKELDQQLSLTGLNNREHSIQSKILDYNKSLEYKMTEDQKAQLVQRLRTLDAMKAQRDLLDTIQQLQSDIRVLDADTLVSKAQIVALERYRLQTGTELTGQLREELLKNIEIKTVKEATKKIETDLVDIQANYNSYLANSKSLGKDFADQMTEVQNIQFRLGAELSKEVVNQILKTENVKRQLDLYKQMVGAVEAVNKPLKGSAAGAAAAGQLGQLDPVTAALTQQQTINNGLQELRNQDLISEQQYQAALINANVMAQQQIYDAKKKQYENAHLLRIQEQTGNTFSFETQKQMATEAANFQMKTDTEKTAWAIDQGAQLFTALGAHNKKAFEAAKAFNIANAIMNTYMGATKALATYPPPFNFIAAGAVIAMGLAQVATIRNQQYSGRQLGGPVMGNQSYIVGENGPEVFTPNTTGSITRNSDLGGGGSVSVNFTIVANDTAGFDQLLTSRQGVIKQIISDAMLERGQRSAV